MKHFRRSTKSSDKGDLRAHHISIPHKDAYAIMPPKKNCFDGLLYFKADHCLQVIKALYDYEVQDPENNPGYLSFTQGEFLHVIGKETDPDWYEACNPTNGSKGLVPVNHFETISKQVRNSQQSSINGSSPVTSQDSIFTEKVPPRTSFNESNGLPRMSQMARNSAAMVYGIVQYDFKAERPDELEARAGEAIIVIAQSNPEWFVAKPITRLGGPGLIPVSFIEIRDMSTGKAVTDPQDAVTRAGVPKVEEWKRMAAKYKNSSIPLGKLDSSHGSQSQERASMTSNRANHDSNSHHRQNSDTGQYANGIRFSQLITPIRARVPRYCHHEMKYWFIVESTMEDGKHWELNREYTDFYALQTALMEEFPEAAGRIEGHKRTLPFMPGPLPWVTERLTSERREHMDRYLAQLLAMNQKILSSYTVRTFFAPRGADQEIESTSEAEASVSSDGDWVRLSRGSSQQSAPWDSQQSSSGNLSTAGTGFTSPTKGQQHQSGATKQPPGHYRNTSDLRNPPAPPYNQSLSNGSSIAVGSMGPPQTNANVTQKIKVFFGDSDCVVIRMPGSYSYADLVQKLRERYSTEPNMDPGAASDMSFHIAYKDEPTGGEFFDMKSDDDLRMAQDRNDKLTLRVGPDMDY